MERLFVYGSLQPGGPNGHVLAAIAGEWQPAMVKGKLVAAGWGASMGYPGLVLDENGQEIQGYIFASPNLKGKWNKLDQFEGKEYCRVAASVMLESGDRIQAYVYVLKR